jgi:alpha-beta hydrolase superfamily lysophospholipase
MSGPSPYRDETDSLRAENARLRAKLARRKTNLQRLPFVLVALDFGAVVALRPWLNGGSDAKFWLALGVLVTIALGAVASAIASRAS